jgi:APA family basic amino acid/polyamine antiporter
MQSAFSSEQLAWSVGFVAVVIGFATASAVAIGFAHYFALFISVNHIYIAMGLIALMSLINFWGIKESAKFNALATAIEVGGLLFVIGFGGYQILNGTVPLADLSKMPVGVSSDSLPWLSVVSASALIFFAYMGFEDIANIAEETKNPAVTLPKAFIYALLISTVIYILVAVVAVSVVPHEELGQSDQPLALVINRLISGDAWIAIALIAMFATANTVLITLIVCARMLFGMARSGSLPSALAGVNKRRSTPTQAIIVVAMMSIIFLFFGHIEVLASIADVGIFILFAMVNLCNIVLRYKKPDLDRPWSAPLSIGKLPVLSVLGFCSCLAMITTINHPVMLFGDEYSSLLVGSGIFMLAVPAYYLLGRGN